jgi:MraZ protein
VFFTGQLDHALDDKGRVSVPAQFREKLQPQGNRLFVTNHTLLLEPCLALYSPEQWESVIRRARQKAESNPDPEQELAQFFYFGRAKEIELDRQGRILIPAKLRDFAQIEREVTFSTQPDALLLWSRSTFARIEAMADKRAREDPRFLYGLK